MRKVFPEMFDRPEKGTSFVCIVYGVFFFILVPFVIVLLVQGQQDDLQTVTGLDIGYYTFNFLCMLALCHRYLKDSFFNLSINVGNTVAAIAICVVLMLGLEVLYLYLAFRLEITMGFNVLPMTETSVLSSSSITPVVNPILGTLCLTLLTPVTVSCLYYGAFFAPACVEKGFWAYLVVAVATLIPRLFNIWWLEHSEWEWMLYIMQLPIHLIACWGYQKTDTVWTPIFALGITNLVVSIVMQVLNAMGLIYIT